MSSVDRFEKSFKKVFNADAAFSFWKARVALYAVLKAFNVGKEDEVILPGYTCVMDVNPIKYLGAKPVYIDIEPNTFNMNLDLLEGKITPKTKVIIAQHTYGYVCDMDRITGIAAKHGVTVIEDCCLCLGSTYKGKLAGTFSKAAYFSFQWNKPFTTGLGGMAITNDNILAEKIEQICESQLVQPSIKEKMMLFAQLVVYRAFIYPKTTAMAQSFFRFLTKKGIVIGSSSTCEFEPEMEKDFFKAMSSIQAGAGIRQLKKLENNIAHRRQMAKLYDELLSQNGWSIRNYNKEIMNPVMVRYPVRIKEKDKAIQQAASAGIELGTWFECPLHPVETPLEKYGYKIGMCPEAEKAAKETVNLPLHPRVSEKTVRKTIDFIMRFKQV
ncbi:MAG: DegT/DnrJ/EryC1/StrS family aminotransferase [Phycisphaerae bacterium]|jgi:dTDP-4-amino-4,6-dideoxygalactose transaminase